MEFYEIKELRKTKKSGSNYDLFESRHAIPDIPYSARFYKVKKGETMRMDLVSYSIYETTEYIDFLCFFNRISNPLNVKENQIIIYVPADEIATFRVTLPSDDVTQALAKANRGNKPDPSREQYLDNNLSLPPNILAVPTEQVRQGDGIIRLGI
jgi:hypothetical protein